MLRVGMVIHLIMEMLTMQSSIADRAVKSPDMRLTTRVWVAGDEKKQDAKRWVSAHPGFPGG